MGRSTPAFGSEHHQGGGLLKEGVLLVEASLCTREQLGSSPLSVGRPPQNLFSVGDRDAQCLVCRLDIEPEEAGSTREAHARSSKASFPEVPGPSVPNLTVTSLVLESIEHPHKSA